jgi:hypothetical protein
MFPGRRRFGVAAWLAALLAVGGAGFLAGRTALSPPTSLSASPGAAVVVRVVHGSVSQSVSFTGTASWTRDSEYNNGAEGVITSIGIRDGEPIGAGSILYTVDLRPVSAATGSVPSFRSVEKGDSGPDIAQLQRFLAERGDYRGRVTGTFGPSTEDAVRRWQAAVGIVADGVVRRGDVIYFERLPGRFSRTQALSIGAPIAPGDRVLDHIGDSPVFSVHLSPEQRSFVPLSGDAFIHHPSGTWHARIASSTTSPTGELILSLTASDGSAPCGNDCGSIPLDSSSEFRVDLVRVPLTSGPLIPVAALMTYPSGGAYVVAEDGRELAVTVLASANGQAIVGGVNEGERIRLWGGEGRGDAAPS